MILDFDVLIVGAGMAGMTAAIYLKRANINTVQDLISKKETEVAKIRNLGKKSLKEVIDKVEEMGLSFRE